MTSTDLAAAWRSVDEQLKRHGASPGMMVRQLVTAGQAPEVHFAASSPDGTRHILVRMPDDWNEDLQPFPRWKGVRVHARQGTERPVARRFLDLEQAPGNPREVFESLAVDVAGALLSRLPDADPARVLGDRLSAWKVFFEEQKQEGLGPDAQLGLFGELWFLRDHVLPGPNLSEAVASWTGPQATNHDFQFNAHAYEIKSSAAKQHQKLHVASERQLDTTGLETLHIIFFSFAPLEAGGLTLPGMVDQVRQRLAASGAALQAFNEKLIQGGFLDAHAPLYRRGYALRTTRSFHVGEGFPRLLEGDLRPGVGDVSYSVVLASCEPFKVSLPDALSEITRTRSTGGPA